MVLLYKKITILVAAVLTVAALAVPAVALAENGNGNNSVALVFCLNGNTVEGGDDIVPFLLWLSGEGEDVDPIILNDELATLFRFFINRDGGVGRFRLFEDGVPVTDFNTVTEGACEAPGQVFSDREFWLCYSTGYPWVGPRAQAVKLYDGGKGWKVPIAVKDDKANGPNIGNGITLSCNFSAYKGVEGVAVSTGGGEIYDGPADLVNFMLTVMPLDFTKLAVPSS